MAIPSLPPHLFFLSIILATITSVKMLSSSVRGQCLNDQRSLLLELKSELIFDSDHSVKLVRWNNETADDDCCDWDGVECDGGGRVISLQLDGESISGGLHESSSLFRLRYLQKLNLAYNEFDEARIPRGIHHLTHLTRLNLSNAGFGGQIPVEVSLLKRLVVLDISSGFLKLEHPSLKMMIQNLTRLRELYLDGVDISAAGSEWCQVVSSSLPHLKILSLRDCRLSGPFHPSLSQLHSLSVLHLDRNNLSTAIPDFLANFSSLTALSLGGCSLQGFLPKRILQVPTLQELDLSDNELLSGTIPQSNVSGAFRSIRMYSCSFVGPIPPMLGNLTNLIDLDLSSNFLNGSIPSFYMSSKLTTIDLSYNSLTGSLSNSNFEGLSNLVYLSLENNSLIGSIPHSIFGMPSLQSLSLYHNQFSGQIDEFPFVNISNIQYIDLSYNSLNGSIPQSLFSLPSLQQLVLSNNQFSGEVNGFPMVNICIINDLDLSSNRLQGPIPGNFFQIQSLRYLSLSDNLFSGLPNFTYLGLSYNLSVEATSVEELDLSNNRISGDIPSWIWQIGNTTLSYLNISCNLLVDLQKPFNISTSLDYLDLHSNKLRGELPSLRHMSFLSFLSLANNSFSGAIPTSICNDVPLSLDVLDLSLNNLSNNIPPCLFENIKNLQVLNLRGNNINGVIPDQFSVECSLRTLDLSHNNFVGKIPKSLENCKSLTVMNVGDNNFDDSFPCMLSSILRILVLRSNRFHGELRCNKSWPNLQIVDLSSNNLSGSLHLLNFSTWRGMILLQNDAHLRPNHSSYDVLSANEYYQDEVTLTIKGSEQKLAKIWPDFTSIDLSCNNFQGDIPEAMGTLTSLYLLNLSHNALTATIPKSLGALTELGSLDLSVNRLRGRIPEELAGLTFLSCLNVSYNELVGMIPKGNQFNTFSANSFEGNTGLCGFQLNTSCSSSDGNGSTAPTKEKDEEIEWEYVCAAAGYAVGLGSIVWLLLFCRSFRERYFDKVDEVAEKIFDRRRRRRVVRRNEVRRQ